jgi:hypothetical protein
LAPLHGYPHHYFNATPQGIRALFEDAMTVTEVSVLASTHPIWSLTWILNIWRSGLPKPAQKQFDRMRLGDLLGSPTTYLDEPFCSQLPHDIQLQIACGTALKARK